LPHALGERRAVHVPRTCGSGNENSGASGYTGRTRREQPPSRRSSQVEKAADVASGDSPRRVCV
jgi:hypothetical protein